MTSSNETLRGAVAAIAFRPTDGRPMQELAECNVVPGRGLDCENRPSGRREVTLLSKQGWEQTCRRPDAALSWHLRRANFLIDGLDPGRLIDRELTIGPICIKIHGETRPCGLMDEQHAGLREALIPECRGGVHGQVLVGGTVRVGDAVCVHDARLMA